MGGLLLLLDVVPAWFARRREAQLIAASASGASLPRRRRPREGLFALFFLLPTLLLLTVGLSCRRSAPPARLHGRAPAPTGWAATTTAGCSPTDSIVRVLINTAGLGPPGPAGRHRVRPALRRAGRPAAVRGGRQVADLHADGDLVRRRRHHLEVRLRLPRAASGRRSACSTRSSYALGGGAAALAARRTARTRFLLMVIMVWIQAGFAMVVLSAAIKAIPADIVEAARLDGATAWQMFWHVTIPMIRPRADRGRRDASSIATLKVFDIVRTMTGGNFDTSVLANEMYNQSFRSSRERAGLAPWRSSCSSLVIPVVIYQIRNLRQQREELTMTHRRRPPSEPAPAGRRTTTTRAGRVRKRLTSRTATLIVDRHRAALDHPHLRPAGLLGPAAKRRSRPPAGGRSSPTPSSPWRTTRRCSSAVRRPRRAARRYFINSLAITIPAVLFPLALRVAGRVRAGLDQVQGPRLALLRDLRAADRAAADGAGPAAESSPAASPIAGVTVIPALGSGRRAEVRPGVDRAHLLRAAARRSSCCTTSSRSCPGT